MTNRWLLPAFLRYRTDLERYARNLGADTHLAEDLATETYLRTWVYFETREKPENLLGFMRRTQRNLYFDHCRRERRCYPTDLEELDLWVDDCSNRVAVEHDIFAALGSLPETPRAVLTCTLLLDMSLAETAATVGLPSAGAAGVAAHRARKVLMGLLADADRLPRHRQLSTTRTSRPPR